MGAVSGRSVSGWGVVWLVGVRCRGGVQLVRVRSRGGVRFEEWAVGQRSRKRIIVKIILNFYITESLFSLKMRF